MKYLVKIYLMRFMTGKMYVSCKWPNTLLNVCMDNILSVISFVV